MNIKDTLGNEVWVCRNEQKIKDLLPETWTHIQNLSAMKLGFEFKVLGIDWRTDDDFAKIMIFFEKVGILLRDGMTVKRNPNSIFK